MLVCAIIIYNDLDQLLHVNECYLTFTLLSTQHRTIIFTKEYFSSTDVRVSDIINKWHLDVKPTQTVSSLPVHFELLQSQINERANDSWHVYAL